MDDSEKKCITKVFVKEKEVWFSPRERAKYATSGV